MRPELNNVLQCLSLNGYSAFSLIDDILAQGCNQEDPRIKLLREGVERDAASICARLLNHNPASASVSAWALSFAHATMMSLPLWKINIVSPCLSPGMAWTSTGGPERFLNTGGVLFKNCTIDVLPDNVFLEIFDFCLRGSTKFKAEVIELTLPLAVDYPFPLTRRTPEDEDNIIYALRRTSRVHRIDIIGSGPLLRKVAAVMQKSFPALTHLDLAWYDNLPDPSPESRDVPPVLPGRFLDGSAPRLQYFRLERVSFPQLPTFLLSARNLITLKVKDICQNGYISPEAMIASLAVLTRLRTLSITFDDRTPSPSDPGRSFPDPPMRVALPALTAFHYKGYSGYLEDFLAQIDTLRVDDVRIEYFMHEIQATQLSRFLDHTENLKPDQFNRAEVTFYSDITRVELYSSYPKGKRRQACLTLEILDQPWLNTQVPCAVQVLGQLVPTFSHVDHLDAHGDNVDSRRMDIADWLPFFRLWLAVETLHLFGGVAAYIVSALEGAAISEEMVTNVFPELQLIWLDEMENEACDEPVGSIERFLAMRELTGFPVALVDTEDEFDRMFQKKIS
ncbi:hypothetical protein EDB83DRAFT_2680688 [Lactarius deliciosus]|nr:hypothetical protein EDB83DRAFT_2680688 [Lactarius deliciosus]